MRHKLQDNHHWVGGSDTAKHLQDVRVIAMGNLFHHSNFIHEETFFFGIAISCNCTYIERILAMYVFNNEVDREVYIMYMQKVYVHKVLHYIATLSKCAYIEAFSLQQ